MYETTEEQIGRIKRQKFLPYARVHRADAGYRAKHMPAGYDWLIFWRQYKAAAFTHTLETVDADDARPLVDNAAFTDSLPCRTRPDGEVYVDEAAAHAERQETVRALAQAKELYPYAF